MRKRKQIIIDKNFQFKHTFSIIAVATVISAIIVAIIASNLVMNNIKIENIYTIEDNIVHFLTSRPKGINDPAFQNAIKDIAINHSDNMKALFRIIKYNKILLIALLVFIIVQSIVLYFLIIRKTHRIAGPLYVMSNYMKDIINGKIPDTRPLRKSDELKEFYDLFGEMVKKLKNK